VSLSTSADEARDLRRRQNNYYWGVMLPTFARELFHDVRFRSVHLNVIEVHLRLKWDMLPFGDDPDKRIEEQVRSTSVSRMSNEDFTDYLNRLTIFAAERGIQFLPREEPDGTKTV
jgi:hypothetical protein